MTCFIPFSSPVSQLELPKKFTFPFYYQPDPIALLAARELQSKLTEQVNQPGRMYGVLVAKNQQGTLGYLSAVSGTTPILTDHSKHQLALVPNIFNGFDHSSSFYQQQSKVNTLNLEIEQLEQAAEFIALKTLLSSEQEAAGFQIQQQQKAMVERRAIRKALRANISPQLSEEVRLNKPDVYQQATQRSISLSRESVQDKKALAQLKSYWQGRIEQVQAAYQEKHNAIEQLKKQRRQLSNKLQRLLFKQYQLLNQAGETKDLLTIFQHEIDGKPPAGAGDCAAPKLLQYAFEQELTPICMAEFWWGQAAKSEIRKHQHFYPSCQGKCQPILNHMLVGIAVDDNPLKETPKPKAELEIVYQDKDLVVVNKPADLLSVPGKYISDSVYQRIRDQFPWASGSLIVHRLDMATSGLLILALHERAHKYLQQQFINKEISKQYVATIEGLLMQTQGEIKLPLRTDHLDRPRQLVCQQNGKPAHTLWSVLQRDTKSNRTKVLLTPVTGRTHQLRVHCAHPQGLNLPIVGDGLYGKRAERLHLHAAKLSFCHPISKEKMTFEVPEPF